MRRASSRTATVGLLVVGVIVGGVIVLGTLYIASSVPAKTVTQTVSQTNTSTVVSTSTVTSTVTPSTITSVLTKTSVSTTTIVSKTTTTTTSISTIYSTTGPNLQIVEVVCSHTAGTLKMGSSSLTASSGDSCLVAVTNTGGTAGYLTGYTIDEATGSFRNGNVTVAAGTTTSDPVIVECDAALGLVPGAAVTGSLLVASGSPLAFAAFAGS